MKKFMEKKFMEKNSIRLSFKKTALQILVFVFHFTIFAFSKNLCIESYHLSINSNYNLHSPSNQKSAQDLANEIVKSMTRLDLPASAFYDHISSVINSKRNFFSTTDVERFISIVHDKTDLLEQINKKNDSINKKISALEVLITDYKNLKIPFHIKLQRKQDEYKSKKLSQINLSFESIKNEIASIVGFKYTLVTIHQNIISVLRDLKNIESLIDPNLIYLNSVNSHLIQLLTSNPQFSDKLQLVVSFLLTDASKIAVQQQGIKNIKDQLEKKMLLVTQTLGNIDFQQNISLISMMIEHGFTAETALAEIEKIMITARSASSVNSMDSTTLLNSSSNFYNQSPSDVNRNLYPQLPNIYNFANVGSKEKAQTFRLFPAVNDESKMPSDKTKKANTTADIEVQADKISADFKKRSTELFYTNNLSVPDNLDLIDSVRNELQFQFLKFYLETFLPFTEIYNKNKNPFIGNTSLFTTEIFQSLEIKKHIAEINSDLPIKALKMIMNYFEIGSLGKEYINPYILKRKQDKAGVAHFISFANRIKNSEQLERFSELLNHQGLKMANDYTTPEGFSFLENWVIKGRIRIDTRFGNFYRIPQLPKTHNLNFYSFQEYVKSHVADLNKHLKVKTKKDRTVPGLSNFYSLYDLLNSDIKNSKFSTNELLKLYAEILPKLGEIHNTIYNTNEGFIVRFLLMKLGRTLELNLARDNSKRTIAETSQLLKSLDDLEKNINAFSFSLFHLKKTLIKSSIENLEQLNPKEYLIVEAESEKWLSEKIDIRLVEANFISSERLFILYLDTINESEQKRLLTYFTKKTDYFKQLLRSDVIKAHNDRMLKIVMNKLKIALN